MPAPKMPSRRSSQVSDHVTSRAGKPAGLRLRWMMSYVRLFAGIKHEWQVNGLDDIQDRRTLAEKLGGNVVVSLEGKPI